MSKNKEAFKGSKATKLDAEETALSDIGLLTHKRIKKGKLVAENPKTQRLLDASLEIAEVLESRPKRAKITKDEAKIVQKLALKHVDDLEAMRRDIKLNKF